MLSNRKAQHCLSVARVMRDKALEETGDRDYANEMFYLGWVHDIGYEYTNDRNEHALLGGEFLRNIGYKYWEEVRDHGNPNIENPSKELRLLNYADLIIDANGNNVGFEARLKDIADRYGENSRVHRNATLLVEKIKEISQEDV